MTMAAYHIVSNQAIYRKLTAELQTAFFDPKTRLDFMTLEKLPYLVSIFGIQWNKPLTSTSPES